MGTNLVHMICSPDNYHGWTEWNELRLEKQAKESSFSGTCFHFMFNRKPLKTFKQKSDLMIFKQLLQLIWEEVIVGEIGNNIGNFGAGSQAIIAE